MSRAVRHNLALLRPSTRSRGGVLARLVARHRAAPTRDTLFDLAEHGLLRHAATLALWPGSVGPDGDLCHGFRRGLPPGLEPGDVLVHLESLSVHVVEIPGGPPRNLDLGLNLVLGLPLTRDLCRSVAPVRFTTTAPGDLAVAIAPALGETAIAVRTHLHRGGSWYLNTATLGRVLVAVLDATPEQSHPGQENPLLGHLTIHHPPRQRRCA